MLTDNDHNTTLYRKWLLLAILSLLLAGLLTFIIVFSRTPIIKEFFILKNFFAKALISHVNLSQLFWTLTIGVVVTITYIKQQLFSFHILFYIALIAIFLIFISPFLDSGTAILNNYIPIIDNLPFTVSISLFMTIILLFSCYCIISQRSFLSGDHIGILLYAYHIVIIISYLNYFSSLRFIENLTEITEYYEIMFWSFGHVMQFAYVILMVIAWFILIKSANCRIIFTRKSILIIVFSYVAIAFISIIPYVVKDISLEQFKLFFTRHMIYGCSFLAIIIAIGLIYTAFDKNIYKSSIENRVLLNSVLGSFLLFFYGGLLGLKITGNNTIIPAHYHGQAVGITIALIGLVYYYLPRFGYGSVKSKLAMWQPILYTIGQFIHISGLAISGGYGALRKSPDAIYGFNAQFWMGIMGFGGFITLISGVMFFVICYKSINYRTANG